MAAVPNDGELLRRFVDPEYGCDGGILDLNDDDLRLAAVRAAPFRVPPEAIAFLWISVAPLHEDRFCYSEGKHGVKNGERERVVTVSISGVRFRGSDGVEV